MDGKLKFELKIETGNAALVGPDGPLEVARTLRFVADAVASTYGIGASIRGTPHFGCYGGPLTDLNGHTVGSWTFEPYEEDK